MSPRSMVQTSGPTLTPPRWAGDYFDRDHMVPGGARLDSAAFAAGYTDATTGKIIVPSGTTISRTLAQRDAGAGFHPAIDGEAEIYISCFDVWDAANNSDVELYRYNSVVYETFLPGFAALSAAIKASLRGLYVCSTLLEG